MHLKLKIFFLMSCLAITAHGQSGVIGSKESLIPSGWTVFEEATGDLNKDSLIDAAVIIENTVPDTYGEKVRSLLILMKNNKTDDTYMKICRADHVILGSESGGVLGDPFMSMEIKKNVLRIDFAGGSADKWETTHRYRLQGGAFYVIGATYKVSPARGGTEIYDYNLSTGKIIMTKNGVSTTLTHKIVLPQLIDFEPDAVWAILMPRDYATVSTCVFQEVSNTDTVHMIFDCGDFGEAAAYLDEATEQLWYDLIVEEEPGDMKVNPKYKGKTFEITYVNKTGSRGESDVPGTYQLVVGFKLKN